MTDLKRTYDPDCGLDPVLSTRATCSLIGPADQPIKLVWDKAIEENGPLEVGIEKSFEKQVFSDLSSDKAGGLFLGVLGSDLGIASKLLSVVPPTSFSWQFIARLWSLVPSVDLAHLRPIDQDHPCPTALDSSLTAAMDTEVDTTRRLHRMTLEEISSKLIMRQMNLKQNLRRPSNLSCRVFTQRQMKGSNHNPQGQEGANVIKRLRLGRLRAPVSCLNLLGRLRRRVLATSSAKVLLRTPFLLMIGLMHKLLATILLVVLIFLIPTLTKLIALIIFAY